MFKYVAIAALLVVGVLHSASGYCCNKKPPHIMSHIAVCEDCTLNEWCCAHGACNIACCNCDGGCRSGTCWARHPKGKRDLITVQTARGNYSFPGDETSGYTIVRQADKDGDGLLSIEEAHVHFRSQGIPASHYRGKQDLHDLDLDGDNYLSPLEIDRDADYYDDIV